MTISKTREYGAEQQANYGFPMCAKCKAPVTHFSLHQNDIKQGMDVRAVCHGVSQVQMIQERSLIEAGGSVPYTYFTRAMTFFEEDKSE